MTRCRWPEQTCRLVNFPFSQLIVLTQPVFTKRQVPWRCSLRSSKDKVLVPTGEVSLLRVDGVSTQPGGAVPEEPPPSLRPPSHCCTHPSPSPSTCRHIDPSEEE